MVETISTNDLDSFAVYRKHPKISLFEEVINKISEQSEDKKLFNDFKPHLMEWMVLMYKHKEKEIDDADFQKLYRKFADEHDNLFESDLFVSLIKKIREKIEYSSY